MNTPKFISFEGIEGAGKSTVIQEVCQWLTERNISFIKTREPGGCEISEQIRTVLLGMHDEPMHPECELLLLMAARIQHLSQVILPHLAQGKWVLCDRFRDATFAYQGGGRGLSVEKLLDLEKWCTMMRMPDQTIYLDLPLEESRKRQVVRGQLPDRIEREQDAFFERVRQMYLQIAHSEPMRVLVIDANQPLIKVLAAIKSKIFEGLE